MKVFNKILPYCIGAIFVFSGISKLIGVDYFVQYVYGLNLFPLWFSEFLARLIIGIELAVGLFFILKIYKRALSTAALSMLFVFTGFIIVMIFRGYSDDCHCFGNLIQLSNTSSIVKNLILMILIVINLKNTVEITPNRNLKALIVLLISTSLTVFINMPAVFAGKSLEIRYCKSCISNILQEHELDQQKNVICFISVNCKYCILAAQRLSVISKKADNHTDIVFFLWDEKDQSQTFFLENKIYPFENHKVNILPFLEATSGTMPLILLYDKGNVLKAYRYSDLNENELIEFLK